MSDIAHPTQMITANSLSVKNVPSSIGIFSGRIFAVAGFQSYMNVIIGAITNKEEIKYKYPASFIHEPPLYSSQVGMPQIAKVKQKNWE